MIKRYCIHYWCLLLLFGCQTIPLAQPRLTHVIDENYLFACFQYLASDQLTGRKVGTKGNLQAQKYLITQLKQLNIKPFNRHYRHSFSYINRSDQPVYGNNIVGLLPAYRHTEQYLVLTAHFDHIGKQGNNIYNGADDNASGSAAILAILKYLTDNNLQLKHNILVIFTDGEESNLKGIKAFIQQNQPLMNQIKVNVNLDMLAGSQDSQRLHYYSKGLTKLLPPSERTYFFQQHSYQNFPVIKGFKRQLSINNQRINWLKASDHYAFYRQRIPFIYYGVGVHKNYHTPSDNYQNANKGLLAQSTNVIYHQLILLDQLISNTSHNIFDHMTL
ncbi:peptidase M28 [Thalassotalea insulae]|uniref:Peptidase M28 n=1 Tax=Thalassotalea insulae TaxID=2056778 RepID=A0ABQ6GYT8_9GAMM|nr:M20/M25/M40 family metallo-hydrolase [Thalassotalea insulae]GLX80394.1 peptidase M28 [Thalassotalea insulae]